MITGEQGHHSDAATAPNATFVSSSHVSWYVIVCVKRRLLYCHTCCLKFQQAAKSACPDMQVWTVLSCFGPSFGLCSCWCWRHCVIFPFRQEILFFSGHFSPSWHNTAVVNSIKSVVKFYSRCAKAMNGQYYLTS